MPEARPPTRFGRFAASAEALFPASGLRDLAKAAKPRPMTNDQHVLQDRAPSHANSKSIENRSLGGNT